MSYRRAEEILPMEIVELIQQYVDGESIYIPRKSGNRLEWGTKTQTRREMYLRDQRICMDYSAGKSVDELAGKYYLSAKSIQRIIRNSK